MGRLVGFIRKAASAGLIVSLAVGGASANTTLAQDADGGIVIDVRVVPASPSLTISAVLSAVGPGPTTSGFGADSMSLDLTVVDPRGSASGWQIDLQQGPSTRLDESLWFLELQCLANENSGQPPSGAVETCAGLSAVGMPLAEPVPVLVAGPGFGTGRSGVRFMVGPIRGAEGRPTVLIVTIASAP